MYSTAQQVAKMPSAKAILEGVEITAGSDYGSVGVEKAHKKFVDDVTNFYKAYIYTKYPKLVDSLYLAGGEAAYFFGLETGLMIAQAMQREAKNA